jgi:hypothetical protein
MWKSLTNGAHEKPQYDHGSANQPCTMPKEEASKQRKGKNQDALETFQIFLVPNLRLRSSRSSSISSAFCVFTFAAICSAIIIRLIHKLFTWAVLTAAHLLILVPVG